VSSFRCILRPSSMVSSSCWRARCASCFVLNSTTLERWTEKLAPKGHREHRAGYSRHANMAMRANRLQKRPELGNPNIMLKMILSPASHLGISNLMLLLAQVLLLLFCNKPRGKSSQSASSPTSLTIKPMQASDQASQISLTPRPKAHKQSTSGRSTVLIDQ